MLSIRDTEQDRSWIFLTNDFTLPALTVAELYHNRWQIELFFKWIKQHLRIKAFYGTSLNAVKTQICIAISTQSYRSSAFVFSSNCRWHKYLRNQRSQTRKSKLVTNWNSSTYNGTVLSEGVELTSEGACVVAMSETLNFVLWLEDSSSQALGRIETKIHTTQSFVEFAIHVSVTFRFGLIVHTAEVDHTGTSRLLTTREW